MYSIVLFSIVILASFLPKSESVPARRLQELSKMDVEQNAQPDLANEVVQLRELLGKVQGDLQRLCPPGKPANLWCEYVKTLERNSRSQPKQGLRERKSKGSECWPGIPFCKKSKATGSRGISSKTQRRSISLEPRCRPGVSICPNGKRTITKANEKRHCPTGWPFCI